MRVLGDIGQESINKTIKKIINKGGCLQSDGFSNYNTVGNMVIFDKQPQFGKSQRKKQWGVVMGSVLASNSKRFTYCDYNYNL